MHLRRLTWLLLLTLIGSCDQPDTRKEEYLSRINEPIVRYLQEKNVMYGTEQYQNFDIYYPENVYSKPSEVVILLHGGAWNYGDKDFLNPSVEELKKARKNLTIININYRLIVRDPRKSLFQHQIEDIERCVNFLRKNYSKYNFRSDKFSIMGASAGGHLALSYAYTKGVNKIHTVIGMSAITDLNAPQLLISSLWGNVKILTGFSETNAGRDSLIKASPVHLANVHSPRTILLAGVKDDAVSLRQQTLLKERLISLRVPTALYVLKDQDHNIEAKYVANGILSAHGADEFDLYFKRN